jgi:hypothetical protein
MRIEMGLYLLSLKLVKSPLLCKRLGITDESSLSYICKDMNTGL